MALLALKNTESQPFKYTTGLEVAHLLKSQPNNKLTLSTRKAAWSRNLNDKSTNGLEGRFHKED